MPDGSWEIEDAKGVGWLCRNFFFVATLTPKALENYYGVWRHSLERAVWWMVTYSHPVARDRMVMTENETLKLRTRA
jgi:hypothetical protein